MKIVNIIKRQGIAILCCLTSWTAFAQRQILVLDKENKQPVAYADVYFPDLKTSTATGANGIFFIAAKNPSVFVQISCMGYKTLLETITFQEGATVYLEPSHLDLQEVSISGSSSKLQGENVVNVDKLSLNNNPETQGLSLSQKLASVAGVSNFSTGAGIGKPVIRGLSGNRIAVFSQGVRIENQQWGDEHGLGLDENGYEHVEIIKGPASLLYGGDALGGVLFFADERYAKENSVEAAVNSEFYANTNGWRNTGAVKVSKNRLHGNLFGGYTTHEDYGDGNAAAVNNSRFRTGDFKMALGYTGQKFISSLKYNFLNEQYGLSEADEAGDDPAPVPANRRKPDFPYQNLTTHLIGSENTFFFENNSKLKIDAGYIFNNRKEFEEQTGDGSANLDMNLETFSYSVKWYSHTLRQRWMLIVGSQGLHQRNTNRGEERLIPDASAFEAGVFAMADYYFSPKSYWQTGVRIDGRRIGGVEYGEQGADVWFLSFRRRMPHSIFPPDFINN
jgi:iron complex outermembrane receptor protein